MADLSGSAPLGEAILAPARLREPDRYLAALLAPAPARPHLLALTAFLGELQRIAGLVREPAMGEIRLQWWREALTQAAGRRTGNPIADALRESARVTALPQALLNDLIDARTLDFAPQAVSDDAALQAYLWKSEGVAFLLAAHILGGGSAPPLPAAAAAGGRAYGLVRLLQGMPRALSRRRLTLPPTYLQAVGLEPETLFAGGGGVRLSNLLAELFADVRRHHAACRQHLANLPRKVGPAFLPLALVASYVRLLERAGGEVLRKPAAMTPLMRLLRMTGAHWLRRI